MSSSSNANLPAADGLSPVHSSSNSSSKKLLDTSPAIRKSVSRNNMSNGCNHNNSINHSPTSTSRAFHKNASDQQLLQKQLTVETAVFPEHQSNLFHSAPSDGHALAKKSSSTPVIASNATATVNKHTHCQTNSTYFNYCHRVMHAALYPAASRLDPFQITTSAKRRPTWHRVL